MRQNAVTISFGFFISLTLTASAAEMLRPAPRSHLRPNRWKASYRANRITSPTYRYRRPTYQESPQHRVTRTVNSPSLYAGPYPFGSLYTWRQYYYGHEQNPLLDRLNAMGKLPYIFFEPPHMRYVPFHATDTIRYPSSLIREWGLSVTDAEAMLMQSEEYWEMPSHARQSVIVSEDPISDMQEQFFSDDRPEESIEQLKLGY